MDSEKNNKYVVPEKYVKYLYPGSIVMIVLGAVLMIGGFAGRGVGIGIIGLLILAGGIGLFMYNKKNNITGAEKDQAVSTKQLEGTMNYERNKKYFNSARNLYIGSIAAMVIGAVLMIIGFAAFETVIGILGLLVIAGGIGLLVYMKKSIVTDAEYDQAVSTKLTGMMQKGLDKLGIDEEEVKEIEPIWFGGYDYKTASRVKKGEDNIWRSDRYEYVILFFSSNEVHLYKYRFDTTSDSESEETDVYFYKDIVSVATVSDTIDKGTKKIHSEYFRLTTAGGTTISASLRDIDNAQRLK